MSIDITGSDRRAARGLAWAALTQALSKGTTVVATLVLARLLVPGDFGLFAVGLLVVNYLDRVKDVGVGAALVYRREDWALMARTGLPVSILSTAALAGMAFLAAPVAAGFFHDPRATDLVRVLAVALLVSGFAVVPESRLRREMDFRRRLVPETAAALVKGTVAIALAVSGLGVWSLVWGQVAGVLVQSALYWSLSGWRPAVSWRRQDARLLLRYGAPSALIAVLAVIHENLDYLVIGHRLDADQLGYYVLAFRMPELLVIGFCIVSGQVLFPLFSRLQDDRAALRRSYLRAVRYLSLVTVPAGLLLAVLADEIVLVLYSQQWAPAIPVLRLLALFTVLYAISFHTGEVFKATGRPGLCNAIAVVDIVLLLPALWFAAGFGITAVAWAVLLVNVALTALRLLVVGRVLRLHPGDLARAIVPAIAVGAAMSLALLLVDPLLGALAPLPRLLVLVPTALAVVVAAVRVLAPDAAAQALTLLRRGKETR